MSFFRKKPQPTASSAVTIQAYPSDSLSYGHVLAQEALSIFEEAADSLRASLSAHCEVVEDADLDIALASQRKQEATEAIAKNQAVLDNIAAITAPATAA